MTWPGLPMEDMITRDELLARVQAKHPVSARMLTSFRGAGVLPPPVRVGPGVGVYSPRLVDWLCFVMECRSTGVRLQYLAEVAPVWAQMRPGEMSWDWDTSSVTSMGGRMVLFALLERHEYDVQSVLVAGVPWSREVTP